MTSFAAALLVVATAAPPQALPPQQFTPFEKFPGVYELNIDESSIRPVVGSNGVLVIMDVEIVLEKPPTLVKTYRNTVSIDCGRDSVTVLAGFGYDRNNVQVTTGQLETVANPHIEGTPITELMNLICPAVQNRNTPEPRVTKKPDIST